MTVTDRDGFYRTALELLARDGRSGLRINKVCAELGVTTGSFHHWFAGWPGFVEYLLERWESEETLRLRALADSAELGGPRLEILRRFALDFPHRAEAAIRSWAHTDPTVAVVQRRVDAAREETISDALGDLVPDPDARRTRASLALAVLIGYQQRQSEPGSPSLDALFEDLLGLQGIT